MPRIPLLLLSLILGAACALLVSCADGSDKAKLLPGETAGQLIANLDQVQQLADDGLCDSAASQAGTGLAQVEQLPPKVDPDLKRALEAGFKRLQLLAQTKCSVTPTETETTETTETATTTTVTTPTTVTQTTATTPPTQTTPPPTTPSDGGGGGEDGGGTGTP